MLPDEYRRFPAEILRQIAIHHTAIAQAGIRYATSLEQPQIVPKISIRAICDELSHAIVSGELPHRAVHQVAEKLQIPKQQAEALAERILKRRKLLARADRVATIRTLYRTGHQTKDIANLLKIHSTTVRRYRPKRLACKTMKRLESYNQQEQPTQQRNQNGKIP